MSKRARAFGHRPDLVKTQENRNAVFGVEEWTSSFLCFSFFDFISPLFFSFLISLGGTMIKFSGSGLVIPQLSRLGSLWGRDSMTSINCYITQRTSADWDFGAGESWAEQGQGSCVLAGGARGFIWEIKANFGQAKLRQVLP